MSFPPPPPPPPPNAQQRRGQVPPPPPPRQVGGPPPPPPPPPQQNAAHGRSFPPAPVRSSPSPSPFPPPPPRQVGGPSPSPPLPPPSRQQANQMNGYNSRPPPPVPVARQPPPPPPVPQVNQGQFPQQQYQQQQNAPPYHQPPPPGPQHMPPAPMAYHYQQQQQQQQQPQQPPRPQPPQQILPPGVTPPPGAIGMPPPSQMPPQKQYQNLQQQHQQQHQQQRYPMQQQQPQQQQANTNPALAVPAVPPLFTRPQVLEGVDRPLDAYYPKATGTANVDPYNPVTPPPADSRYIVYDDGNASPDLIRCSLSAIPTDRNVLRQATGSTGSDSSSTTGKILGACMGAICTPMALPSSDHPDDIYPLEHGVESQQAVDLPSSGEVGTVEVDYTANREAPPRCNRCMAYVNPFWTLRQCNFCGSSNRSVGTHQHASKKGSCEYPVQGPYITRRHRPIVEQKHAPNAKKQTSSTSSTSSSGLGLPNPVQPNWVIAIDISTPQVISDVDFVLEDLWPMFYERIVQHHSKHNAKNGKAQVPSRVSMVFVSASGIFLPPKISSSNPNSSMPLQFTVMPDVQLDPFCPLPLEEWSWSLPAEYDAMMDVWKNTIRPTLLPQLVQDHCRELKVPTSSSSASTSHVGGYALSAGGAAMAFLQDALRHTGGRGVYWSWRRPNYGVGALTDRERDSMMGGEIGNISLYSPLQDNAKLDKTSGSNTNESNHVPSETKPDSPTFYSKLGDELAKSKVALDVIMHTNINVPQAFLDIATLSRICDSSCGRFIKMVRSENNEHAWRSSVAQELLRPWYLSGWDAIFKVRCSIGLSVKSVVSSVGKLSVPSSLGGNPDELELGVVTPETCIGVTLEHRVGGVPKGEEFASVQTALLYTNPWTGERRVRVSTVTIRTSQSPETVARAVDFNTLAALQLRLCLPHSNYVPSSSGSVLSLNGLGTGGGHPNARIDGSSPDQRGDTVLVDARFGLVEACCQMLIAYRKLISQSRPPSSAEFLVPPCLETLPLFVLSALKCPLLRPSLPRRGTGTRSASPSPRGDERAYYFYHARRISPSTALHLVHPLLFGLGGSASPTDAFDWHNVRESGPNPGDVMTNLKYGPVVKMPPPLQATVSNLDEEGIYLLATCFNLYVVVEEDAVFDESIQSKIANAAAQLQIWSQVGREGRCLKPLASLPIVHVMKSNDPGQYQALLRWMVLDATSHEKDFNAFCVDLNKRIVQGM